MFNSSTEDRVSQVYDRLTGNVSRLTGDFSKMPGYGADHEFNYSLRKVAEKLVDLEQDTRAKLEACINGEPLIEGWEGEDEYWAVADLLNAKLVKKLVPVAKKALEAYDAMVQMQKAAYDRAKAENVFPDEDYSVIKSYENSLQAYAEALVKAEAKINRVGFVDGFYEGVQDDPSQWATHTINDRYLSDVPLTSRLTIVKSAKNTGKTTWLQRVLTADRVVTLSHRHTLLRSLSVKLGIPHFQDVDLSQASRVAITFDSVWKLDLTRLKGCTLVVDEISQGLAHLTGSTVKEHRPQVVSAFLYLLLNADQVICLDADVTKSDIELLSKYAGCEANVVYNSYKSGGNKFYAYQSKDEVISKVLEAHENGQKVAIACDTKLEAKVIYRKLVQAGAKVLLVTSETVDNPEVQAFVLDPSVIQGTDQHLVYSPSLSTGFDINFEYFDTQFLLGSFLPAYDLHQMVSRVRQSKTSEVHCHVTNPRYEAVQDVITPESFIGHVADLATGEWVPMNGHLDEFCNSLYLYKEKARRQSCNDLALNFYIQAVSEGNTVVTAEAEAKVSTKAIRKEIKASELEAILANPPEYLTRAWHVRPDQLTAEMVKLHKKDKAMMTRALDYAMYQADPELATELLRNIDKQYNRGKLAIDQRHRLATVKLFTAVLADLDLTQPYSQRTLEQTWLPTVKKHKKELKQLLSISFDKTKLCKMLSEILAKKGLKALQGKQLVTHTDSANSLNKRSTQCARERTYFLCPESEAMISDLVARGLARHQEWLEIKLEQERRSKLRPSACIGLAPLPEWDTLYADLVPLPDYPEGWNDPESDNWVNPNEAPRCPVVFSQF